MASGNGSPFKNISGAATTLVVSGQGALRELTVNAMATGATITVYDSVAGSGTKIATITAGADVNSPQNGLHDVRFNNGLTIVTTGTVDLTVTYN